MSGTQARVPTGLNTGGRFHAPGRSEAQVALSDLSVDHVAPSEDVIDKSLSVSGLNLDDPLSDYSATEMRDAFRVGHEMGALAGNAASPSPAEAHAVAKRLHIRECGACHGADQSCAQIEEIFLTEARLMLAEARKARLSA